LRALPGWSMFAGSPPRTHMGFWTLPLTACLLAVAPAAPTPLAPEQAALLAAIPADPPPEHITNDAHFISSNENQHYLWKEALEKAPGGVFVGIGTDQNYIMAPWSRPDVLVLVDFDQLVIDLHQIYRLVFLHAKSAREFVRLWLPSHEKDIAALIEAEYKDEAERKHMIDALHETRGFVSIRLKQLKETYTELKIKTFLDDPAQYDWLVGMWKAGRVRAVRGDLTANLTLKGIADAAKKLSLPVRVLYLSNTERYFKYEQPFKDNMLAQPYDDKSVVLRTVGLAPKGGNDPYLYLVQKVDNFDVWLRDPTVTNITRISNMRRKTDTELLFNVTATPSPAKADKSEKPEKAEKEAKAEKPAKAEK
jgi:hypothetical protein